MKLTIEGPSKEVIIYSMEQIKMRLWNGYYTGQDGDIIWELEED